jgi:prepilin-type N-terminal cleavage/methylation domain-containing protein
MAPPAPHSFAVSRRRPTRGRGGFTLLELVLVMVVLCVIMAIAVPQLRGFLTASGSRDSATQIVALAQYARSKSASEAVVYRLSFDAAAGEYWLSADANDGTGEPAGLGNDFGQVFTLPTGMRVEIEGSPSGGITGGAMSGDIEFRPDGTSDPVVVRLTDADGFQTLIAAPAPTEPFRVMTQQEVNEL